MTLEERYMEATGENPGDPVGMFSDAYVKWLETALEVAEGLLWQGGLDKAASAVYKEPMRLRGKVPSAKQNKPEGMDNERS